MPASISLGRIAGIPIGLHYSWFIIAALISMSLAARFRLTQPHWGLGVVWAAALVTAVLFFTTLLLHELSHAVVARRRGLPVRSITLFALGGIAQMEQDANTARTEFLVAIVGPITSFVIGAACLLIAGALGWSLEDGNPGVAGAVLGWLGAINIGLGAFNLIPGYPLDGGRVLRAVLWGAYKDERRATRNAARTGQVVALIFIGFGLVQAFSGAGIGGLWLAFIGWFLLMAAQASYAQVAVTESLEGVRVADVMAEDCVTVDPDTTLQAIVDDVLLRRGRRCLIVRDDGHVLGLVTPQEIRAVERSHWPVVSVARIMRPIESLKTVHPDTPAAEALMLLARHDINQMPVVENGRLQGIVSRGDILRLLQARAELSR